MAVGGELDAHERGKTRQRDKYVKKGAGATLDERGGPSHMQRRDVTAASTVRANFGRLNGFGM